MRQWTASAASFASLSVSDGERAIAEHRDEREDRERDQELDQREAGATVASSLRRLPEDSPRAGRARSRAPPGSATTISILRNAGLGVPETVSRQTKRVPACTASPSRRPGAGHGGFELRRGEPVLRDPQRERALLQQRGAVGRLRDRAHPGGQRDREDGERDEDFD